jgi:hypothetical protein
MTVIVNNRVVEVEAVILSDDIQSMISWDKLSYMRSTYDTSLSVSELLEYAKLTRIIALYTCVILL